MNKAKNWSSEEIAFLRDNSDKLSTKEISEVLNRPIAAVYKKRFVIGIKLSKGSGVQTVWTDEMITFLKSNYQVLTNKELAVSLNLTLTVTRNKLHELNLIRVKYDNWTTEQVEYLKENYQMLGDTFIAEFLNTHYPKSYPWTKPMIRKKRLLLGLMRTGEESRRIMCQNSKEGKAFTILQNSSSINLKDGWIAQIMSGGSRKPDKELKSALLKHKDLLELKRNQIKLKRQCQTTQNQ